MKKVIHNWSAIIIGGLVLTGCSTEDATPSKAPDEAAESVEVSDATTGNQVRQTDMKNKAGALDTVESLKRILDEPMDPALMEEGLDKEYGWYLKSERIKNQVDHILPYMEESDAADFHSLQNLSGMISHSQYMRTAHIDNTGGETEAHTAVDRWKTADAALNYSYMYIKQIVHDLDIALNHNGVGDTYGVTYMLDGNHLNEVNAFLSDGVYRGEEES
ncbi:hypothetical protein [Bacillus sp. KH172YL63]|uniref:hypothetical protein n=1 Tax=Bacillus sp. KH172YL63 TaxID=2709784 RepID=UPI0013E46390|nr:hypothetical protein [Bacillus sp. KH172YL63]BCB04018.1 hypothetical protein KH172YL63_21510 [Bacillus sp. KH172YL63]